MDNKHYKDYEKGPFDNQETLCLYLRNIGYPSILEDEQANPLTVRLISMREGYKKIQDIAKDIATIIPQQATVAHYFKDNNSDQYSIKNGISSTNQSASGSMIAVGYSEAKYSGLLPNGFNITATSDLLNYDVVRKDSNRLRIETKVKVPIFQIYHGMYLFFMNAYSCLDRLRWELNCIYKKNIGHWYDYLKSKTNKQLISRGYNKVYELLSGKLAKDVTGKIGLYRNRLAHDGHLPINIKNDGKIYMSSDPKNAPTKSDVELAPFISSVYTDLLKLLDTIYEVVLDDIKRMKKVPLP